MTALDMIARHVDLAEGVMLVLEDIVHLRVLATRRGERAAPWEALEQLAWVETAARCELEEAA
jgi:hypothetical protein